MEVRIQERIKRFPGFRRHCFNVLDLVDVDSFEERLVADTSECVVNTHVNRVHVPGQGEAVFKVCSGLVVFNLSCVNLPVEECQSSGDTVLLFFEKVKRNGSGVVGMEQAEPDPVSRTPEVRR